MARTGVFERIFDGWEIAVEREACRVSDLIGFTYLDVLLRYPGKKFSNQQVMAFVGGVSTPASMHGPDGQMPMSNAELRQHFGFDAGTAGAWVDESDDARGFRGGYRSPGYQLAEAYEKEIDPDLLRSTQRCLARLRRDEQAARASGDHAKADRLKADIKASEKFLSKSLRLGRPRKLRTESDRAREAVSVGIRRAIAEIRTKNPIIADYFARNIRLGRAGALYRDLEMTWQQTPWHFANGAVYDREAPDVLRRRLQDGLARMRDLGTFDE